MLAPDFATTPAIVRDRLACDDTVAAVRRRVDLEHLAGAFSGTSVASPQRSCERRRAVTHALAESAAAALGVTEDADAVSKRDLLAFVLGAVIPGAQVEKRADALLAHYGSLAALLAAPGHRLAAFLRSIEGAALLKAVHLLSAQLAREPVEERALIDSPAALFTYLKAKMAHERTEMVRLLFLDVANKLLGEEVHSRGTLDHCPLYPREVVRRILEMNAGALIIVHNHPSGDPRPSDTDTAMTQLLARTLQDIGVSLHDHVIIGTDCHFSYREHGHLGEVSR